MNAAVALQVPVEVRTLGGQLIHKFEQNFRVDLDATEADRETVERTIAVSYRGATWRETVAIPTTVAEGGHVTAAVTVTLKPRAMRDIVRDERGEIIGSREY
ncbi:MAG TPA: hypothetical protein VNI55_12325 [Gaiellaceae bacterium]|nr:hypothetical protein [Gaiellaceae bacterium]